MSKISISGPYRSSSFSTFRNCSPPFTTGSEHYIRGDLVEDDVILDATAPESLVYAVDGDQRTLAGAMYIASQRPADDPSLTDFAGPLMTWHKHDNLCWDTVATARHRSSD